MDEGWRVHRTRSKRAGSDQRNRRRGFANVRPRRYAAFPIRSSDVRPGEGWRISVRARAESARRHHRAKILTCDCGWELRNEYSRARDEVYRHGARRPVWLELGE